MEIKIETDDKLTSVVCKDEYDVQENSDISSRVFKEEPVSEEDEPQNSRVTVKFEILKVVPEEEYNQSTSNSRTVCSYCRKEFTLKRALNSHIKDIHPGCPINYKGGFVACEICGKIADSAVDLSSHAEIHSLGKKTNEEKLQSKQIRMGKKLLYSVQALKNALEAVRNGVNVKKASRDFCVPASTLRDKLSGRTQECKFEAKGVLSAEEEENVIKRAEMGYPVTKDELKDSVAIFMKLEKRRNPFKKNRPGRVWMKAFLRRNPNVAKRTPQKLKKIRAQVTQEDVEGWFSKVQTDLENCGLSDIPASRVFNCDETSFFLCPHLDEVVGNEQKTVTTLFIGSAAGAMLPPMLVLPYERIPWEVTQSIPADWSVGRTGSGSMKSDAFYEYVVNDFYPWLIENKIEFPVILYVDGHNSHLTLPLSDFCSNNQIEVVRIFPNATHVLQPLDVGYFSAIKEAWRTKRNAWTNEFPNSNFEVKHLAPLLEETMRCLNPEKILPNSFERSGLYPFNPEAIDKSKFVSEAWNSEINVSSAISCPNENTHELALKCSVLTAIRNRVPVPVLHQFEEFNGCLWQGPPEYKDLFLAWCHFMDVLELVAPCVSEDGNNGEVCDQFSPGSFDLSEAPNQRKRDEICEENMLEAIKAVLERGNKPNRVAKDYNLCRKTLEYRLKKVREQIETTGTQNITSQMGLKHAGNNNKLAVRQVFTSQQEACLAEYLMKYSRLSLGFTRKALMILAYEWATFMGISLPESWQENKQAGKKWMHGFLERNKNLTIMVQENTSRTRSLAFNNDNVVMFQENLDELMRQYSFPPDRIWNLVTTGIRPFEKVNIVGVASASGATIPPVYIFHGQRLNKKYMIGAPSGSIGFCNDSALLDAQRFLETLHHFKTFAKPSNAKPVLLIMDSHTSHTSVETIKLCRDLGIYLLTFPPHTSYNIQPLDVSVYKSFKTLCRDAFDTFMTNRNGEKITTLNIVRLSARPLVKSFSKSNIQAGFRKTGVHPVNHFPLRKMIMELDVEYRTEQSDPESEELSLVPQTEEELNTSSSSFEIEDSNSPPLQTEQELNTLPAASNFLWNPIPNPIPIGEPLNLSLSMPRPYSGRLKRKSSAIVQELPLDFSKTSKNLRYNKKLRFAGLEMYRRLPKPLQLKQKELVDNGQ
ncbi:hypothetical protein DMENIID0001_103910 [Sergentomyia squamirostris]